MITIFCPGTYSFIARATPLLIHSLYNATKLVRDIHSRMHVYVNEMWKCVGYYDILFLQTKCPNKDFDTVYDEWLHYKPGPNKRPV